MTGYAPRSPFLAPSDNNNRHFGHDLGEIYSFAVRGIKASRFIMEVLTIRLKKKLRFRINLNFKLNLCHKLHMLPCL